MNNTPLVGAIGTYTVKSPFAIKSGVVYECVAIRSFTELAIQKINVFATYYEPVGLLQSDFQSDKLKATNIITLNGRDGSVYYVPDTYIESYPNGNSVAYNQVIIGVDLGPLPSYLTYDTLREEIEDLCLRTIGVTIDTTVNIGPLRGDQPTYAQAKVLEASRLNSITNTDTPASRLRRLETMYDARTKELDALKQWCVDKGYLT